MNFSILYEMDAALIAVLLVAFVMIAIYCGHRLAHWRREKKLSAGEDASSTIFGTVSAVLGLILAFTFSMSAGRFDDRRKVITQESNDISTAILRCDLYPDETRAQLRAAFKHYVEARIEYMEAGTDLDRVQASLRMKDRYADTIWRIVMKYAHDNPTVFVSSSQMIPALNAMIDVTTTRLALDTARVPDAIIVLLLLLSVLCGFYGGYVVGHKAKLDWIVMVGFSIVITVVIFTTLDLERSRRGITNLNANNRFIIQLRDMLK